MRADRDNVLGCAFHRDEVSPGAFMNGCHHLHFGIERFLPDLRELLGECLPGEARLRAGSKERHLERIADTTTFDSR